MAPPKTSGKSSARLFSTAVLNALTPRFTLKTEHDDGIRTKRIFWIDDLVTDKLVQGLDEGVVTAEAMSISRGLADLPGNVCTPAYLAEAVQNAAAGMTTVEVEVLDEHQIEELGMGAFPFRRQREALFRPASLPSATAAPMPPFRPSRSSARASRSTQAAFRSSLPPT